MSCHSIVLLVSCIIVSSSVCVYIYIYIHIMLSIGACKGGFKVGASVLPVVAVRVDPREDLVDIVLRIGGAITICQRMRGE